MAGFADTKCRLCRREGTKLFLKGARCNSPKCPFERKGAVPPGQHGLARRRGPSEYGIQLREKQKAKRIYNIPEKQFRNYYVKALKKKGATGETLLQLLETRLDNVVFLLGFAPSRNAAKQMIRHGLVLVDDKKVTISSYQVKPEQIISLKPKALKIDAIKRLVSEKRPEITSWLQKKAAAGKMLRLPQREEMSGDINEQLIVEYYSR